jgi:NADH-quinone oxidoreductase subunit N
MIFASILSFPATPEIFLVSMTCVVLLVELFVRQKNHAVTYFLAQLAIVVTLLLTLRLYAEPRALLFNGSFIWDPIAGVLKMVILAASFFIFIYARDYIRERRIPQGEYYVLSLFSILGMLVLVSAYSFITLYLGLELTSLPLYALVALRRDMTISTEAAMKYFVMGAIASGMLLYGFSMLYGATHSLDINIVVSIISTIPLQQQLILIFGLVFVLAGILFKFGAAPFHMWVPDVYQGAPTSVTLFVGTVPKLAALGMAIRLLIDALPNLVGQWHEVLILTAVLSIAAGNLVAIVQSNIKRMLAYSAIAHIGYMTLGLLAATPNGYAAAMFYMIAYTLMSLGAFAVLVLMSKAGIEVEQIKDLRGLNTRSPWLAFMMLLIMFSMAGVPPSVGFFAKLGVLEALIAAHIVWLATLALVFAIIGAYYYLNVVKVMYFEEPEDVAPVNIPGDVRLAITINGLLVLGLGLFPSGLINVCRAAFLMVS